MSTVIDEPRQFLRGTTAQNDAYTGPVGSFTIDTDLWELRIHDGVTAGGHRAARLDLLSEAATTDAGLMSASDKTKLDGIAAGATANQADAYLLDADNHTEGSTNTPFTIAEQSKLSGVEEDATANDTDAELRDTDTHTAGSTNTPYSLAEQSKLAGIEAGATADDLDAEVPDVEVTANSTTQSIQDWIADLDSRVTALEP